MKNKVKETFNQLANFYESKADTTSLFNSEFERPAMLAQLPQNLHNKDILDAGCAAGWYTWQLLNLGANVVATDMSQEMINSTIRRVGKQAKVMCIDLEEKLPFKDQSFDLILSSLTLHYIKDWKDTFNVEII